MSTYTTHGFSRTTANKIALIQAILALANSKGIISFARCSFIELKVRASLSQLSKADLEEVLRALVFTGKFPAHLSICKTMLE